MWEMMRRDTGFGAVVSRPGPVKYAPRRKNSIHDQRQVTGQESRVSGSKIKSLAALKKSV
jgi:hypothetical protein